MGLDGKVHCVCWKNGLTRPHPSPELVRLLGTGQLALDEAASLAEWTRHDIWLHTACAHPDTELAAERLGNAAGIWHAREYLNASAPGRFPILFKKVIYSGVHSGDCIEPRDAERLKVELIDAKQLPREASVVAFVDKMLALCDASIETGNPIVF